MSNVKNHSNGLANLCCQPPSSMPQQNNIKPLTEQNVPKKTIRVIDAPHGKSLSSIDTSSDSSSADQPKMKIIEDENNMHGIKLTDIALPHISVKTIECKKSEKPTTTIVIYKPKNSNRAPTAKVIMTKVRDVLIVFLFFMCVISLFHVVSPDAKKDIRICLSVSRLLKIGINNLLLDDINKTKTS